MSKTNAVTLTIQDIITLNLEIPVLLEEEISFVVKWDIVQLKEKAQKIVDMFINQRVLIFKKYSYNQSTRSWDSPDKKNQEVGEKEISNLLDKKEDFKTSLKLSDFNKVQSKFPYVQIMKFLK